MESQRDALVEVIRAIIGPSDKALSKERILALLTAAGNDPNKAVDLYFQAEAANGAQMRANDVEGTADDEQDALSSKARELNDLLGGDVANDVILALLQRTNNNLQKAVEIYFAENGTDAAAEFDESDDEDDAKTADSNHNELFPAPERSLTPSPSSAAMPQTPSELMPIAGHPLVPLVAPIPPTADANTAAPPAPTEASEADSLAAHGMYEVTVGDANLKWQIGSVFGRAVVQWVDAAGPAARAGIHKSDVLLAFGDSVVNDKNCASIVQVLAGESVPVPAKLRFRRAPDQHSANGTLKSVSVSVNGSVSQEQVKANGEPNQKQTAMLDEDGDVVMASQEEPQQSAASGPKPDPKYGLQILCHSVNSMVETVVDPAVELKSIVDLLLLSEFNMDRAVNTFLNEGRVISDFRRIVGYDWDLSSSAKVLGSEPYSATIPAGPLGLTVENILERTIVVDIKMGGAAERASVKRSSWLVGLNGVQITNLTHKETLRMIESASRPLELQLVIVPQESYKFLRKQLAMNIRQQKTERPIPEQDRMSFRVFQLKIHQAVLAFPKIVTMALFQYLSAEEYHPPTLDASYENPLDRLLPPADELDRILLQETQQLDEEVSGEMGAERRFLLNLFATIHEYDDKGESTVIRTIQFLGWLATRCAAMQQYVNTKEGVNAAVRPSFGHSRDTYAQRYNMLLCVVVHVLESLSIIENHATWDVMVNALKMVIRSITDEDISQLIVPMFARHSVSPSPTARIVPIALLPMVYPRVYTDVPVQLRGMLDRMCSDDNPLVRRAITSIIGDLANAAGKPAAAWAVQLLEKATADSHDIVRIFAVKGCIQLAVNLRRILESSPAGSKDEVEQSLRLIYLQMVPMVNTYTSDSSWQVRLETAKTLAAFCRVFGSEYSDVFVDHFVSMVRDPTVEVRRACAEGSFEISDALMRLAFKCSNAAAPEGVAMSEEELAVAYDQMSWPGSKDEFIVAAQTKIVRSVLPATFGLSTDVSVAVRLALARSVGKSLKLIGGQNYEDLVPIFVQFLDDSQDATVRASLLEEMARYCDSSSETVSAMIFPAIQALMTSAQWRVRVKFVECVAAWGERVDGTAVPSVFANACLELLADSVHDVRAAVCRTLPILVKSLGSDWLSEHAVPKISACLQSTFHGRLTGLQALEVLATELQKIDKLADVIETVVEESTSKTANLRFRALRTLGLLVPLLNEPNTTTSTLEIVRQLTREETETDADVRETALATQALLEAQLS